MWTLRLWAFSKRFPHWSQANSSSVSALCLVMWYLSDARCLHWKPQISHLQGKARAQHPAQRPSLSPRCLAQCLSPHFRPLNRKQKLQEKNTAAFSSWLKASCRTTQVKEHHHSQVGGSLLVAEHSSVEHQRTDIERARLAQQREALKLGHTPGKWMNI